MVALLGAWAGFGELCSPGSPMKARRCPVSFSTGSFGDEEPMLVAGPNVFF